MQLVFRVALVVEFDLVSLFASWPAATYYFNFWYKIERREGDLEAK